MKVLTYIKKLFGENSVVDYMDVKDEDDSAIEYYAVDESEDDCEPTFFIRLYTDGLYTVKSVGGDLLYRGYGAASLKKYLKEQKLKLAQPAN